MRCQLLCQQCSVWRNSQATLLLHLLVPAATRKLETGSVRGGSWTRSKCHCKVERRIVVVYGVQREIHLFRNPFENFQNDLAFMRLLRLFTSLLASS